MPAATKSKSTSKTAKPAGKARPTSKAKPAGKSGEGVKESGGQAVIYRMVTERILEALSQGVAPWRKPWRSQGLDGMPRNAFTGKAYRGVNVISLLVAGYDDPRFATYKAITEAGGSVKPGAVVWPVVYWNWVKLDETDASGKPKSIPFMRYYRVFNIAETEGLSLPAPARVNSSPVGTSSRAEAVLAGFAGAPKVLHRGDRACYSPARDLVTMPVRKAFESPDAYYSTLYHELAHSTGHKDRLGRDGIVQFDAFGTDQYAKEELIAEMAAGFLAMTVGIDNLDQSASYVGGWLTKAGGDHKLIVSAAQAAQKAADRVLGITFGERAE